MRRLFISVPLLTLALVAGLASPGIAAATWTVQTTPDPQGATYAVLNGVACPGSGSCEAVGTSLVSGAFATLVERWNGTAWAIHASPNPSGSTGAGFNAVACSATNACTAVGFAQNGTTSVTTLVERWDGSAWTIQNSPNPNGWFASALTGVTCSSATDCVAVGISSSQDRSKAGTLIEAWNGSKWSIQPTPNAKGVDLNELYGVSCPGSTCEAVGWAEKTGASTHTLALTWNGSKWKIAKSANPGGTARAILTGLSCIADSLCVAAGYYEKSNDVTLVETWNGSRWTVQKSPSPKGASNSYLQGIACMSLTACTAVGYWYGQSSVDQTLVESWNGTKWSIESSPNPPHSSDTLLGAVAYRSATARTAVGYFVSDSGNPPPTNTLAEGSP